MSEERLRKTILKLERQLKRSEKARRVHENIADQQQVMLRNVGRGLERALHTVERQNVELGDMAEQLEASLMEAGEARSRAERASRAKTRFLTEMSHNLRTPMTALVGMLEFLDGSGLSDIQSQYLKVINAAAGNILELTEQVVDMDRIETGVLTLQKKPLDLVRILESVCRVVSPDAQSRGMEVVCLLEPDLPGNLLGDERRLQHALVSLAAVTVHEAVGGEMVLRAGPDPTLGPGGVLVEIICLPEQRDLKMFAGGAEGHGLGLSTARQVLALMGAKMRENRPGGIRFTLQMTFALVGDEPRPVVPMAEGTGRRVLVASSSANMRLAVQRLLEAWGATVQTVTTGKEVQQVVHDAEIAGQPFDLAILDGDLGDASGADAGMRLRFGVMHPPAVHVLCALPELSAVDDRVRRMGLAGCLLKPLVRGELFAVLSEQGRNPSGKGYTPPDLDGVRVLIAEDNPANLMVLQLYLENTGCIIDTAEDGKVALTRFAENGADIVLMDIQMPVMDGYETTRTLRRYELENALKRTPVVAVTADAFAHDRENALASGCDEYLPKPVRRNDLLDIIAKYTGRVDGLRA